MKNPSVLARLMGRGKPAPVVSSLALAALNRTLLVEPTHAEAIIGGYLSGSITSADTVMKVERVRGTGESGTAAAGDIGVINVSGGLVNRPMPGASGPGPASYATLREQFDELLADDNVSAIVFRIESPGGMASGCFDLTDHIFAARGAKPIHALVDDYAFSAAYALAAACDEIWVSRTGGVGSVGVCGFHEDWSDGNAKMGLKVTPVFAGKHKIDFSQDFPLSDAAKARWQEMVDDDYGMFVETVARYRGLESDYVQKTEAGIYFGQKAVDARIATRLGTWDDLVAHLGAPAAAAPDAEGDGGGEPGSVDASASAAAAVGTTTGDGSGDVLPAFDGVVERVAGPAASADPASAQGSLDLDAAADTGPDEDAQAAEDSDAVDPAPDESGDAGDTTPPADDPEASDAAAAASAAPPAAQASPHLLRAQAKVEMIGKARAAKLSDAVVLALADSIGSGEVIQARISHAKQVISLCTAAGGADPVPFIRNHTDIAQVRGALVEAKARADDAVRLSTSLPASDAEKSRQVNRLDPTTIYRKRG